MQNITRQAIGERRRFEGLPALYTCLEIVQRTLIRGAYPTLRVPLTSLACHCLHRFAPKCGKPTATTLKSTPKCPVIIAPLAPGVCDFARLQAAATLELFLVSQTPRGFLRTTTSRAWHLQPGPSGCSSSTSVASGLGIIIPRTHYFVVQRPSFGCKHRRQVRLCDMSQLNHSKAHEHGTEFMQRIDARDRTLIIPLNTTPIALNAIKTRSATRTPKL